ncbi:hypothetical protein ACWEO2_30180 [Nocardia sp. NPDC004278]
MTDIVPAEARGPADLALADPLDAAAADYDRPIQNTEEAYRVDWRAWLRFLEDLNSTLAEDDPHGAPVPPTTCQAHRRCACQRRQRHHVSSRALSTNG